MSKFSIVVAMGEDASIGYFNTQNNKHDLPWKCKHDMLFFKNLTTTNLTGEIPKVQNVVIMGKNTYLSLPNLFLKDRINIVISSSYDDWRDSSNPNIIVFPSFENALNYCNSHNYQNIYVIGGEKLYSEAINHPQLNSIIVSVIPYSFFKNDVLPSFFFPLSLTELNNYSVKKLIYKKHFLNVYSFE